MTAGLKAVLILAVLGTAAFAAHRLTPTEELGQPGLELEELIPERFGEWVAEPQPDAQVLLVPGGNGDPGAAESASYDDVLMRTYRRSDGARIMMALAYSQRQTQELKIHRPELCYYAQGFEVQSLGPRIVDLDTERSVSSIALLTQNRSRIEVVTYWIRLGDGPVNGPWDTRLTIFREGLAGRVPDGLLVRASSLAPTRDSAEDELALQAEFLADLYGELSPEVRRLLSGGSESAS